MKRATASGIGRREKGRRESSLRDRGERIWSMGIVYGCEGVQEGTTLGEYLSVLKGKELIRESRGI